MFTFTRLVANTLTLSKSSLYAAPGNNRARTSEDAGGGPRVVAEHLRFADWIDAAVSRANTWAPGTAPGPSAL